MGRALEAVEEVTAAITAAITYRAAVVTDPRETLSYLQVRKPVVIVGPPTIGHPTQALAVFEFPLDIVVPDDSALAALDKAYDVIAPLGDVIDELRPSTFTIPNGPVFYGYTTTLTHT